MLNCCLIIWYVIFVLSLVHKEISNDLIITCKLCYLFICQPRYLKYISFSVINILIQIIRNFNQRLKILWCCPFSVCTIIQNHRYYRHYCFLITLTSVWSTFISWYSCRHSFLNLCLILYAIQDYVCTSSFPILSNVAFLFMNFSVFSLILWMNCRINKFILFNLWLSTK